jgi:hypothetical protein
MAYIYNCPATAARKRVVIGVEVDTAAMSAAIFKRQDVEIPFNIFDPEADQVKGSGRWKAIDASVLFDHANKVGTGKMLSSRHQVQYTAPTESKDDNGEAVLEIKTETVDWRFDTSWKPARPEDGQYILTDLVLMMELFFSRKL